MTPEEYAVAGFKARCELLAEIDAEDDTSA